MSVSNKLPITAIVASCNEGYLLERCLKGLFFCNEIIIINLECNDDTDEIATRYGAKILHYPRYPVVEESHFHAIPTAKNTWVLLTDPDEVVDPLLAEEVITLFNTNNHSKYAAVRVPVQFYFKQKALKGTIWGGDKHFRFLFNKDAVILTKIVHQGIIVKDQTKTLIIDKKRPDAVMHHYWMASYRNFIEKHHRYIRKEGKRMYENNLRFSVIRLLKSPLSSFKQCYWHAKGYKDGVTGLILSIIWAYYNFFSWISLYRHEKKQILSNTFQTRKSKIS